MAKTNIRGTQIADGSSGVDLTVDVFGVLPTANGGVATGGSAGQFYRQDKTWQSLLLSDLPDAWVKRSVKAATTANITLSAPQTIDGVSCIAGDRVLVKNQTLGQNNGIYDVAAGAWVRSADADTASEVSGATTTADQGTQAGIVWTTTFKSSDTLGTTSMSWAALVDTTTAVDLTSVQTLTNKILTAPKINQINDTGGAPALGILATASAVNYLEVRNQVSGSVTPVLAAVGSGTDLNINLVPKGVGQVFLGGSVALSVGNTATGIVNKTFTAPRLTQTTTPSTPAAGTDSLYTKADDNLYLLASDAVERVIPTPHPVRVSSAGSLTLSGTQTIDGVACVAGDRVMVRHQGVFAGNGFDNGIWVVAAGAWSRAVDANTSAKLSGAQFTVAEGTWHRGKTFQCAFDPTDTLGTTALTFINVDGEDFGGVFSVPLMNARSVGSTFTDSNTRYQRTWMGSAWFVGKGLQDYSGTAPSFPSAGELWYDSTNTLLKVYTGSAWVATGISDAMPIGTIFAFGGVTAPAGCLIADASSQLRTAYPDLFTALTFLVTGSGASGQKVITTTDTTNLRIGMRVEATGLSGGADTVSAISAGVSFSVGSNLTGTITSGSITVFPHGAADATHFNLPSMAGKVAVGKDSSQPTEFGTVGFTGGDKNLQQHAHNTGIYQTNNEASGYGLSITGSFTNRVFVNGGATSTTNAGTGNSQNLQPYNTLTYCVKATSLWQNQGMDREWINTTPAAPTTGLTLFSRTRGRRLPAFIGPTGQDNRLQPSFAFNTICSVNAINNSTTPDLQTVAVTHLNNATATPTAVAIATTNLFTSLPRYRCATTTTAGTGGGTRSAAAQWMFSSTFNKGGFHFVARFGFNLIAAGSRSFVGLSTTTTALNPAVDPSTLLNQVGFGFDAADTNLQFMRKDGTTAVKVDTGMAKGTGGTDFYEVELFAASGGGASVWYCIRRLTDDTIFRGAAAITTNIPAVDTLMSFHAHVSNGAVAAAHSIDIKGIYVESDV